MKGIRLVLVLSLLIVGTMGCSAGVPQPSASNLRQLDSLFVSGFDFVDMAADTIIDPTGSMTPFYNALSAIGSDNAIVPIIHFGDSHVEGGALTESIMRRLAHVYGTAGRGFITPHKLAGANEPRDYSITSSRTPSRSATIIDGMAGGLEFGLSGSAVDIQAPSTFTINTHTLPLDSTDYRFNRLLVVHDSLAPMITTADPDMVDQSSSSDIFNSFITEINLTKMTDSITLRTFVEGSFARGPIHGFVLENGRAGVIYHSIGINSACFVHWGRYAQIAQQSAALYPQLIIVSLGSNEASGLNFVESVFTSQMDSFVSQLRAQNPNVPLLLTTPVEAMRRRNGTQTPNTNFARVAKTILDYAREKQIAVIDLYGITSAQGSATKWREAKLLSRDGIHCNSDGYKLQGILIFNALTRQR